MTNICQLFDEMRNDKKRDRETCYEILNCLPFSTFFFLLLHFTILIGCKCFPLVIIMLKIRYQFICRLDDDDDDDDHGDYIACIFPSFFFWFNTLHQHVRSFVCCQSFASIKWSSRIENDSNPLWFAMNTSVWYYYVVDDL